MFALEQKIRSFLHDVLGVTEEVNRHTSLVTTGLIDSVGLVRLAALIEAEAGIVIPDVEVNAENFDSIARICAYVRERSAQ